MRSIKLWFHLFYSELKKVKAVSTWVILSGAPLFVVFINFMIYFSRPEVLERVEGDVWFTIVNNSLNVWSLVFLSLLITMLAFLINNSEHVSNGWKHIFTLPVKRWKFYAAKFSVLMFLIIAANVIFYIATLLEVGLLNSIHPQFDISAGAQNGWLMFVLFRAVAASILTAAILFIISVLFSGFMIPIGSGVAGTILAMMVLSWEKSYLIPFTLSFHSITGVSMNSNAFFTMPVIYGLAGGAILAAAGIFLLGRRNVV